MEFTSAKEVLVVEGLLELTAANRHAFLGRIRSELNGHRMIEIDLSRAQVMDCAGLGALVALRNWACERRVALRLTRPVPPVHELFALVRPGRYSKCSDLWDSSPRQTRRKWWP